MFKYLAQYIIPGLERKEDIKNVTPLNEIQSGKGIEQAIEDFKSKLSFRGKDLKHYSQKLLSAIAREKEISQGVFFITESDEGKPYLKFLSGFAYQNTEGDDEVFEWGEGFPGQVAKDKKLMNITDIPDGYMSIESGLGKASPASLIIFPVIKEDNVIAVIELASFHRFGTDDEKFFEGISMVIADQITNCLSKS